MIDGGPRRQVAELDLDVFLRSSPCIAQIQLGIRQAGRGRLPAGARAQAERVADLRPATEQHGKQVHGRQQQDESQRHGRQQPHARPQIDE